MRAIVLESDIDYLVVLARQDTPRHLRTKLDFADVVQEATIRLHRVQEEFARRSAPERREYMRQAVRSTIADLIRRYDRSKRGIGRERLFSDHDELSILSIAGSTGEQESPGSRVILFETLGRLTASLEGLPENQRKAIELHHLQGRSVLDTSAEMDLTVPAVAGLLRRGLATLRRSLAEDDN